MSEAADQPPFFQGVMPFALKPNRLYRVYPLPGELIFLYAGSGGEISAAAGAQFGLIGGLIAAATSPARANEQRRQQLDRGKLDELVGEHKHSFRAPAADLADVRIDPRSFWLAAFYSQPFHVGVLRLTHRDRGKMRLCLASLDDLKKAVETVPAALGGQVEVNVEWDERKRKFVRKR